METPIPHQRPELTSSADLVKRAIGEARELVELEVRLAKDEIREELSRAKKTAIGAGVALSLGLLALGALVVALILALGGSAEAALIVALALAVLAGGAAWVAYALAPKSVLPRTRRNLKDDLDHLKEHVA